MIIVYPRIGDGIHIIKARDYSPVPGSPRQEVWIMYYRCNFFSSISGGIVLIGLALAFLLGRGEFSLPLFFVALPFSLLLGSLSSGNPRAVYGGIQGFIWLLGLAFCFYFTFST